MSVKERLAAATVSGSLFVIIMFLVNFSFFKVFDLKLIVQSLIAGIVFTLLIALFVKSNNVFGGFVKVISNSKLSFLNMFLMGTLVSWLFLLAIIYLRYSGMMETFIMSNFTIVAGVAVIMAIMVAIIILSSLYLKRNFHKA